MIPRHTQSSGLHALRALARGHVHGGYVWALVMYDGELLCERCTRENYRQLYRATTDTKTGEPDWCAIGITNSGESDDIALCADCGRVIWTGADDPTDD